MSDIYKRRDGKVQAKVLGRNEDSTIYWAAWPDNEGNAVYNLTACSNARFDREFVQ